MTKAAATRAIRQRIHHALLRHGWLVRKVKGEPHGWPNSQAFVPGAGRNARCVSAAARRILKHRSGVLIQAALGESEGTRTLLVEPGALQRSSLYSYDPASKSHNAGATIAREVPVTTIDTLLRNHAWQAPFGLKMDVQGAELEIIRGGARFLEQTEFVIAEVNVIERYPGSYTFAEFIAAMDRAGFRVCDVLDIVPYSIH